MSYLFWSYPFLFHFPVKGGNFLPLSFKPLVSSTIFILISFKYLSFITLWSFNSSTICKSLYDIFNNSLNSSLLFVIELMHIPTFVFIFILFLKNILLLLLYPKHVIKLLGYNLGCYKIRLDHYPNMIPNLP